MRRNSPLWALASALLPLFSFLGCGPESVGVDVMDPPPEPVCMAGDTRPAEDGCNTCTCDDDGEGWSCTEVACSECTPGDLATTHCGSDSVICSCGDEGNWHCPVIDCGSDSEPECSAGERRAAGDGCNTCSCFDGRWGCTMAFCPQPLVCSAGFGDCNGDPSDVCEVVLDWSPDNCGGCGVVCTAPQVCENGQCSMSSCNPSEDPTCTDCACVPLAPTDMSWAPLKWPTVACLCGAVDCLAFSEAWAGDFGSCSYRRSGCGVDEISLRTFAHGWRYQFITGTMVAGMQSNDTTFGPCMRFGYQGGEFMDLTECEDFTECLNCPEPGSGGDPPPCETGE